MARFYNKSTGNLPLTLTNGKSVSIPRRTWVELTGADETCASVMRARRKGDLHCALVPVEAQPAAAPVAPAPPVPVPVNVISEEVSTDDSSEAKKNRRR